MTAIATETDAKPYGRYLELTKELKLLGGVNGLLGWDMETNMPPKAMEIRAEENALLAGIIHERLVSEAMGEVLDTLEAGADELDESQRANVRESRRFYDRARKLPKAFVAELSRTTSLAHEAWVEARKKADWDTFAPHLAKILELKRREAELVGYEDEAYDALLDEYEPGARAKAIAPVLESLRDGLVPIAKAIAEKPPLAPIAGTFPQADQEAFCREVAAAMGFDFEAGRLDVSAHPFCSGFQPRDVRLTTRYDESDIRQALFGVIHEAGHGLYEQGLRVEHFGTPMGEAASTGIHESQSRLWENMVARSRPFWEHFFPILKARFPAALEGIDLDRWHRWVNEVKPSFIRVEADEVTYNLHILLRFEIERELFAGRIEVADLPELWNEKMEAYLGLTPPDAAKGVLQDIHWSFGGFGYFPTYSLGNLYAAQIFEQAEKDLPSLWADVARGDLAGLKGWLNREVHARGMLYRPEQLVEEISGRPLTAELFTAYIREKFSKVYGL